MTIIISILAILFFAIAAFLYLLLKPKKRNRALNTYKRHDENWYKESQDYIRKHQGW